LPGILLVRGSEYPREPAYAWHEVTVAFSPKADYGLTEEGLLEAVNSAHPEYRQDIERQHGSVQQAATDLRPKDFLPMTL